MISRNSCWGFYRTGEILCVAMQFENLCTGTSAVLTNNLCIYLYLCSVFTTFFILSPKNVNRNTKYVECENYNFKAVIYFGHPHCVHNFLSLYFHVENSLYSHLILFLILYYLVSFHLFGLQWLKSHKIRRTFRFISFGWNKWFRMP